MGLYAFTTTGSALLCSVGLPSNLAVKYLDPNNDYSALSVDGNAVVARNGCITIPIAGDFTIEWNDSDCCGVAATPEFSLVLSDIDVDLFDYDSEVMCEVDPATNEPTGEKIRVQFAHSNATGLTDITYQTFAGADWAGDPVTELKACSDVDKESDDKEFCVDDVSYTRTKLKLDGVPTGDIYWTDDSGAIVADPIPTGIIIKEGSCYGQCEASTPIGILTNF